MSSTDDATRAALASIQAACAELSRSDDDVVRMFALRVDALTRALVDSVLADLPARE